MKRTALALALASLTAVPGMAADLPSRAPPPVFVPPPPLFTWTGFYIGGYGGYSFEGREKLTFQPARRGGARTASGKIKGGTGGGLVGYNYQFSRLVIGVEGEGGFDGEKATTTVKPTGAKAKLASDDLIARVRGRVGFAAGSLFPGGFFLGDALIFAAGGGSFLSEKDTFTGNGFGRNAVIGKKDRFGFNVGGGVDFAITTNWILRAEYIYDDFGKEKLAAGRNRYTSSLTDNTVRGAIEYKF